MLKKFFIFTITIFILGVSVVFGYDNANTHPQLSRAAENVYNNSTNPNKITSEQMKLIEKGSINEDAEPRYVNHFYNPKTGKGLIDNVLPVYPAKEWAQKQTSATGDYSYQTILNNYKQGDKERAWQGVGHILHLIQDMSVPAHVRIDSHPDGDPYEVWAQHFGKIDPSKSIKNNVNNLNQVFHVLATYTYDNFFSQDTVVDLKYDEIKTEKDYSGVNTYYAYRNGYKIAKVVKNQLGNEYSFDYNVNQSYWNLLSPKAIGYSAGVIELFANEFKKIDDQKAAEQANMSWLQKVSSNLNDAIVSKVDLHNIAYVWGDAYMAMRPSVVSSYETTVAKIKSTGSTVKTGGELVVDTTKTASDKLAVATGEVKGVFVAATEAKKPVEIIDNKIVTPKVANVDEVKVARVIDGDTIELKTGEKVRYIGVDSPELNDAGSADDECLAWAAKVRNEQLIQSGQVRLVSDNGANKDAYGRLLRYAYVGNTFVNGQLANEGLAKVFFCQTGWNNCPVMTDATRKKIIQDAANAALANKRGLYSAVCAKEIKIIKEPDLILVEEKKTQPVVQELAKSVQVFFSNGATDDVVEAEELTIVLDDGVSNNAEEVATATDEVATSTDDVATTTEELATSTLELATTTEEVATSTELSTGTTTDPDINFDDVDFIIFGLDTGNEDFTGSTTVGVRIDGISVRAEYFLSEYEDGLTEDSIWLTEKPENFIIDDNDYNEVEVFLWIKQNDNILSTNIHDSIILDMVAPEMYFDEMPDVITESNSAYFEIDYEDNSEDYMQENYPDEEIVTWNYKLDDGDWMLGDNDEFTFDNLASGEHIFSIEMIDRSLNVNTITYSWVVSVPVMTAVDARANHLVISEIQIGSNSSTTEEFIELHNPNSYNINMSNYRLTRKTKGGTEYNLISSFGSMTIYGYGYLLISNTRNLTQDGMFKIDVDAVYTVASQSIAADNTIILYDNNGNVVDKVGYGDVGDYESQPLLDIVPGTSVERKNVWDSTAASMTSGGDSWLGNSFDTNNNFNDFIIRSNPEPQNRSDYGEPLIIHMW